MHRLSLSGPSPPRRPSPGSHSLIHSFNNHAMGTRAGPFRRAPAPVPEHPQPPGAALRFPHPSDAALRTPPRRAPLREPGSQPRPGPHLSAHAPRPASRGSRASAPIRRVRPAGFVERRSARPWRHPAPGSATLRARDARIRGPERVGRDHRPLTSSASDPWGLF